MKELFDTIIKYKNVSFQRETDSYKKLLTFAGKFYADVAEVYDAITRIRNIDRNPRGFDPNDAAILGLLVRIWKVLKGVVYFYNENNLDLLSMLSRQVIEASIMAQYLLNSSDDVLIDYRKCAYKDRIKMLDEIQQDSVFCNSPPGKRLISSINEKLVNDGFDLNSFIDQKRNKWRVQGKTFKDIFTTVSDEKYYKYAYGLQSESIHGSWLDSVEYNVCINEDKTYSADPFYQDADVRFVTPLIKFCNVPYIEWLKRIDAEDKDITRCLCWIDEKNDFLYERFEELFVEK